MTCRVEVNGVTLSFEDRGAGEAVVVLLHGGLASGVMWDAIATRLAAEYRVITPDSRGHGRSTASEEPLSYPIMADDVAALIRALDLRAPVVAGWSDGGQVAMELAVCHPRAAGAFIVGGANPDFVNSGLRDVHRGLLEDIAAKPDDEFLSELKPLHDDWDGLLERTRALWLGYAGLPDAALGEVSAPVLVLAGDRDELVGLDLSIALYRRFPRGELAVCPAASHESPGEDERAEILSAIIHDFCSRHASVDHVAKADGG